MRNTHLTTVLSLALTTAAVAQTDWPRWRGPANTDQSPDQGLLKSWPKNGPKRLWLFSKAGQGYSGFSMKSGKLFTMGTRNEKTGVFCLDAATGEEKWFTPIGEVYPNAWGGGPRSTPTLDGDAVYAVGGKGDVVCLSMGTGKMRWSRKMSEFGGRVPKWGYSESVLVDGDRVVLAPGGREGALVALAKETGKTLWQSKAFRGAAEYSSVVPATLLGKKQYVRLLQRKIGGVDVKTGELLWSFDWGGKIAVIPTPIVEGNRIYVTSGYGVGCMMLEITPDGPKQVWRNRVMKNHHGGVVKVGDYLFGHGDPGWVCQKWSDGSEVWRERDSLGKGAIHYADGMLYCLEKDSGVVALVDASSAGYKEASRFTLEPQSPNRADRGRIWVHPVVLDGRLYLRDQEYLYCYDVRAAAPGKPEAKKPEAKKSEAKAPRKIF